MTKIHPTTLARGPHLATERRRRRAHDKQVSVFVDAVSSAIGPAVVETVRGAKKTQVSGAVAAAADLPHSTGGATTARERNNIRRRNGDLVVENISTTSRDPRPLGSEKQRAHGGWQSFRGPRHGGSMNAPAHHTGTSGDDSGGTDEALLWDAVEFAEVRRKMLDPPKVKTTDVISKRVHHSLSITATNSSIIEAQYFALFSSFRKMLSLSLSLSPSPLSLTTGGPGRYRHDPNSLRTKLSVPEARGQVRRPHGAIITEEPHHFRGSREAHWVSRSCKILGSM